MKSWQRRRERDRIRDMNKSYGETKSDRHREGRDREDEDTFLTRTKMCTFKDPQTEKRREVNPHFSVSLPNHPSLKKKNSCKLQISIIATLL